jgi:hypothetical protein
MNWPWTPWTPVPVACRLATATGLYQIRSGETAGLIYVRLGMIRLKSHLDRAYIPGHCQAEYFSGDLAASWAELPGIAGLNLLEHENGLIAAHVLAIGDAPAAQFLG